MSNLFFTGGQYPGYNQQGYSKPNSGSSFSDQISNSLKQLGTEFLKNALAKTISGRK